MKRSVVLLVSVASVVLFAGSGFAQATFDLKFDAPGGMEVSGAPGATVEVPITLILGASDAGVTGMSYSLGGSSPDGVDFELLAGHPIPCSAPCMNELIPESDLFFFTGGPTDPNKEPDEGSALFGMGPQGQSYVAALAYNPLSLPPFQLPAGDSRIGLIKLAIVIPAAEGGGTVVVAYRNGHQGPGEPVNNGITFSNATQVPTLGSITITAVPQPQIADLAIQGDDNPGVAVGEQGELSVTVAISSEIDGDDGVAGWQLSIQHSSNIEITDTEIAQGLYDAVPDLCEPDDATDCDIGFEATDFGGDVDPDLIFAQSDPPDPACELTVGEAQGNGLTSGVTFALPPDPKLDQELPGQTDGFIEVMVISYRLVDPMPNEQVAVSFDWVNCMKGVGVRLKTGVTVSGKTVRPRNRTGLAITIDPVNKSNFRRHDANNDSLQDLSDAVFVIDYQFFGGETPPCPDAADANNDEKINIADAIEMISVTFRGKAAIPPFAECGTDDESDSDSCPPNSSTECNP